MTDETTPQDSAAMSPASDGSVVAWAVMDGTKTLVGYHSCSRDKAEAWAKEYGFPEVVPLYRSPSLTDAEREAVEYFSQWCIGPSKRLERYAATLRGLLERLK